MSGYGSGWTRVTADQVVTRSPAYLHSLTLLTSAGGGDVNVYEGGETGSGRQIIRLEGANNISKQIAFNPPLVCEAGLYVDVGSNVSELLVHWSPIPASL